MTERAIKSNEHEAMRLYERGVAAARGGQRRVAAGLLARAVQLNPRHELGWLWLSGVLDAPEEIAFCLRSVLTVNPYNERAQQGLAWLEQRGQIVPQPVPAALAPPPADEEAIHERDSWWVGWRRVRRDSSRARLVLWLIPILLLALTIGLNQVLRDATRRNLALALEAASPPQASATPAAPAEPALIQAELASMREAQVFAYLSAIETPRLRLRDAVTAYRTGTGRPGGSSVTHAAAARGLREQIDTVYATMAEFDPPAGLAQAHASYLAGLELERRALADMLEFYQSLSVQYANRATLRMIDSARAIERARQLFDARRAPAPAGTPAAQTIR